MLHAVPAVLQQSSYETCCSTAKKETLKLHRALAQHGSVNDAQHSKVPSSLKRGQVEEKQSFHLIYASYSKESLLNFVYFAQNCRRSMVDSRSPILDERQDVCFVKVHNLPRVEKRLLLSMVSSFQPHATLTS